MSYATPGQVRDAFFNQRAAASVPTMKELRDAAREFSTALDVLGTLEEMPPPSSADARGELARKAKLKDARKAVDRADGSFMGIVRRMQSAGVEILELSRADDDETDNPLVSLARRMSGR